MAAFSHGGDSIFNNGETNWWDVDQNLFLKDASLFTALAPNQPQKKSSGKRSRIISKDRRGSYFKARSAQDAVSDLALDATFRAAAPQQKNRRKNPLDRKVVLKRQDFRKKVRSKRASTLLLFLVDLSWSMAVQQRMDATRVAILSLLTDAYQHRDRVGLITFQKDSATLVLAPTHSITLAERSMKKVQIGGKTPLASGLWKAHEVLSKERRQHPDMSSLLIVLTDGAGNVPMAGGDPMAEAKTIAETIAAEDYRAIVIDLDSNTFEEGLANQLAKQLNAPCYLIAGLEGNQLAKIIRREL